MRMQMTNRLTLLVLLCLALTACHGIFQDTGDDDGSGSQTNVKTFQKARWVIGQNDFNGYRENQGSTVPTFNTLKAPSGRPSGPSLGPFYIPDQGNNRILGYQKPPAQTNPSALWVLGQNNAQSGQSGISRSTLNHPAGTWVRNQQLFVADTNNNRILIWNTLPKTGDLPSVVVGQDDFDSRIPAKGQNRLDHPKSVITANGKLIIADSGNNRVLIYNSIPTSNNAKADVVIGQHSFSSDGSGKGADELNDPEALWSNGSNLIIADTGNNRVLIFNSIPTSSGASANVVVGQPGFGTNNSDATRSSLNAPQGIYASSKQLIVADTGNNRVLVYGNFPTQDQPDASAVIGQDSFDHYAPNDDDQDGQQDAQPTDRTLNNPTAVDVQNGRLYVTDTGNNRVLIFSNY